MIIEDINKNYEYSNGLLSFLEENDEELLNLALKQVLNDIDLIWININQYFERLDTLCSHTNKEISNLSYFILSKVLFYRGELHASLDYALNCGKLFQITEQSSYTSTVLSKAFEKYSIQIRNKLDIDDKLNNIMNEVFSCSLLDQNKLELLIGITIETRRKDILTNIITKNKENSNILQYLMDIVLSHVNSIVFRNEIISLIAMVYRDRSNKTLEDYYKLSKCLMLLLDSLEFSKLVLNLFNENEKKMKVLGLQIISDAYECENLKFNISLLEHLKESNMNKEFLGRIEKILTGEFTKEINPKFLSQNNHVNNKIADFYSKKFVNKFSVSHNSIISLYSILYSGISDENYLKSNNLFKNIKNWGLFTLIGSVGAVFKNSPKLMQFLNPYINSTDSFTKGGALYGYGLSNVASKKMTNFVETGLGQNQKEEIIHGACLSTGLISFGGKDENLYNLMKPFLLKDKANQGEAAGYGIGMLMCGELKTYIVNDLLKIAKDCIHEKINKGICTALALMSYNNQELAENLINEWINHKNYILRIGAVQSIGMAYVGTSNAKAIQKLLNLTSTDVNNDVRKFAAISLGFICLRNKKKALEIYTLLKDTYNEHLRYGICIGLGIVFAGTGNKEAIKILKKMKDDKMNIVVNGAMIGLGMILQLQNPNINEDIQEIKDIMIKKCNEDTESNLVKLGCMIGLGVLESGGNNSIIKLISSAGTLRKVAICGMFLFSKHWDWFPLIQMIHLTFEPCYLLGVTEELKIPQSFKFKCNAKKSHFYYQKNDFLKDNLNKVEKIEVELAANKRVKQKKDTKKDNKNVKKDENNKDKEIIDESEFYIIENPSRMLNSQINKIEFDEENRYEILLNNRRNGIVFLNDKNPELKEEYIDDKPMEKYLIPPPEFIFSE